MQPMRPQPEQYYMAHHFLVRVRAKGKPWRSLPVVGIQGGTHEGTYLELAGAAGPGSTMLSEMWEVSLEKGFELDLWNGARAVGDTPAIIRRKTFDVLGYDVLPYDFNCMEARVSLERVHLRGLRTLETTHYSLATLDPSVGEDVLSFARRLSSVVPSSPGTYALFFAPLPEDHQRPMEDQGQLRITVESPEGQPPYYRAQVNVRGVRVAGCMSTQLARMQQVDTDPGPPLVIDGHSLTDVVATALHRARMLVGRSIVSALRL